MTSELRAEPGVAQSGRYAVQGLGILVGLTAATMLATSWTHLRGRLIQARPNGPESP